MKRKQSVTAGEMVKFFGGLPPDKVLHFVVCGKEEMSGSDHDGTVYTDLINIYCDPPTKEEDPRNFYCDTGRVHVGSIEAQTTQPVQELVISDDVQALGWAPRPGKKKPPKKSR